MHTLERVPNRAEVTRDKGYQGVAAQVDTVTICDATTGQEQHVPRLSVRTPRKQPRGGDLTDAQKAANRAINPLRVRVEHCIGWVKNWAILATQFRCSHAPSVHLAGVLVIFDQYPGEPVVKSDHWTIPFSGLFQTHSIS